MISETKIKLFEKVQNIFGDEHLSIISLHAGNSLFNNFLIISNSGNMYLAKSCDKNINVSRFDLKKRLFFSGAAIADPIAEFDLKPEKIFCTISEWIKGQTLDECISLSHHTIFCLAKSVCNAIISIHKYTTNYFPTQNLSLEINSYISYIKKERIIFPHMCEYFELIKKSGDMHSSHIGCVHMDFHSKNIIIDDNGKATLIDCEDLFITDPWRDFVYAVAFHNPRENLFWFSLILEYFNYVIPKEFWAITKYYSIIQLFRMIICNYKKENYLEIVRLSESLFITYNGLKNTFPVWSLKYYNRKNELINGLKGSLSL